MTDAGAVPLHAAVVLRPGADGCEVVGQGRRRTVRWSLPFAPRAGNVAPGHLVALAAPGDGAEVVLWRWFDAVVLDDADGQVRLWEPAHGEVLAQPRRPARARAPGSRAYLSAGLPGAEWWVAGPAVAGGEDADVELDEVHRFYVDHGLWDGLT